MGEQVGVERGETVDGFGHEKDDERSNMLAFCLEVVFCYCVETGMARAEEGGNVGAERGEFG